MPMHSIWNPWHGCHKCSAGCEHCYMYSLDAKRGVTGSDKVKKTGNFNYPVQKNRQKQYKIQPGERLRVNMTSDTFIEEADGWRDDMWAVIKKRPDVIFWLLTKRPERIPGHLPEDWGNGYPNVMLNITCENQEMFDIRWPVFKEIPAMHKGLCLAPLIGGMDIGPALSSGQIAQVEAGGENYENPRECRYEWVKQIADCCMAHRINFCLYETGTNFIFDGKKYYLPRKADQSFYAYMLGLNREYYKLAFNLKMPDGSPAPEHIKMYNKNHCAFCGGRPTCSGCADCGECGPTEMMTLHDITAYEKQVLPQMLKIR